jgi:SAM-dependent methyltransferase
VSYFDHFAASPITGAGNRLVRAVARRHFVIISHWLANRESAILEIGPGRGELAHYFTDAGYRNYTVVEPNEMMRQRLSRQGLPTRDYLIPKMAEPDNSYDAIILKDVYEHLNGTLEAQVFIAEAWRVLRPGGLLSIGSPDYLHWHEDFFNSDFSHSNVTSVRRVRQIFQDGGFQTVHHVYFSGFTTGFAATLVSWLVRVVLGLLHSDDPNNKIYKLKLTFLRQFLIIGRKRVFLRSI